jgi:hypothetical protein
MPLIRSEASKSTIESDSGDRYAYCMITIVVADDHGIVREGLRRLLESETDFKVCGEAADGRDVLDEVQRGLGWADSKH